MVVLKNTGSPLFEEAYFILRDKPGAGDKKYDMVSEANRIIAANVISPQKVFSSEAPSRREKLIRLLFFVLGGICGAAAAMILFLVF